MEIQTIRPAVAIAIFDNLGNILLQQRRDSGSCCVLSGHVEFGESISAAVLREIWEETGVEGEIRRFIGLYSSPESQTYRRQNESIQYVTAYFEAVLKTPLPAHYPRTETLRLQFFPPNALPENMAQMHPQWLRHAAERNPVPYIG